MSRGVYIYICDGVYTLACIYIGCTICICVIFTYYKLYTKRTRHTYYSNITTLMRLTYLVPNEWYYVSTMTIV